MTGRERVLSGNTTANNNAFVMRIGSLLLIEFGVTNNACFVYDARHFRLDLDNQHLQITELKQAASATKLSHTWGWETKFDSEICPRIGFWPPGHGQAPNAATSAPGTGNAARAYGSRGAPLAQEASTIRDRQSKTSNSGRPSVNEIDALLRVCRMHRIKIDDLRPKGGTLWICPDDASNPHTVDWIKRLGFRFKPGRGYWLPD